jgi:hypothetical protein
MSEYWQPPQQREFFGPREVLVGPITITRTYPATTQSCSAAFFHVGDTESARVDVEGEVVPLGPTIIVAYNELAEAIIKTFSEAQDVIVVGRRRDGTAFELEGSSTEATAVLEAYAAGLNLVPDYTIEGLDKG